MEAALGWIGAIFEWFGAFVPRWTLVRATEGAVKFLPGGRTCVLGPGIHWYWPATTELETVAVVRQVADCQPQTLMTKDDEAVYVSGLVIYRITDLYAYMVDNYDAGDNLNDVLQTAIRSTIVNRTFVQIQEARANVDTFLTHEAQKALAEFGIEVEAVRLTDFAKARVTNMVGTGLATINLQR